MMSRNITYIIYFVVISLPLFLAKLSKINLNFESFETTVNFTSEVCNCLDVFNTPVPLKAYTQDYVRLMKS